MHFSNVLLVILQLRDIAGDNTNVTGRDFIMDDQILLVKLENTGMTIPFAQRRKII